MPDMRDTIKNHQDFIVQEDDLNARCAMFFVRARPTKFSDGARYGLIVTKRLFRHAVDRNRSKRLLRDWIRFNEKNMHPDLDYIFIARAAILNATRTDGRVAMRKALGYIKKLHADKKTEK